MALARRGSFTTIGLTPHATTNIEVIERFLEVRFNVENVERGTRVSAYDLDLESGRT